MASRLALLIVLWFALGPAGAWAQPRCLRCHGVHFAQSGSCVECHRGDERTDRVEIAHHELISAKYAAFRLPGSLRVAEGRKLLDLLACRRCHNIGGRGNRLAADLDAAFPAAGPEELAQALRAPAFHMPDFHLTEDQIVAVVNGILAFSVDSSPRMEEIPLVVHFADSPRGEGDAFTRHCGACHKVLTAGRGGLGTGDVGPNLSGLLTEFYPRASGGQSPWTEERLRKWIGNPREILPFARMRPVTLSEPDLREVVEILGRQP